MSFLEKLVASPSDGPAGAEDVQEGDHYLGNNAPDNVFLFDESGISFWLRLVKSSFDKCPDQSMQKRLDEDDSTGPPMQEVEVLVWDTSDERQDTFTRAKSNCKRRQSISQRANTITPASKAGSDRFQMRVALSWGNPSFVSHANETVFEVSLDVKCLVEIDVRKDQQVAKE